MNLTVKAAPDADPYEAGRMYRTKGAEGAGDWLWMEIQRGKEATA